MASQRTVNDLLMQLALLDRQEAAIRAELDARLATLAEQRACIEKTLTLLQADAP